MIIRFAKNREKEQVKNLWEYSFTDDPKFVDYFFENEYDLKNNVVLLHDGKLIASLILQEVEVSFYGKIEKLHYIVGVSVAPEYRGYGFSTMLMQYVLTFLAEKKEEIVLLMPIDSAIYRRYGFINIMQNFTAECDIVNLSRFRSEYEIEIAKDPKTMALLYEHAVKKYDIFRTRDINYYEKKISAMKVERAYPFFVKSEEIKGGGFFNLNASERTLYITETICKDSNAWRTVLSFAAHHRTQADKLVLDTPDIHSLELVHGFDNKWKVERKPFMMARALNPDILLKKWIKRVFKYINCDRNIVFMIKDDVLKTNETLLKLNVKTGRLNKGLDEKADVVISPEGIVLLYLCGFSFRELVNTGYIISEEKIADMFKDVRSLSSVFVHEYY